VDALDAASLAARKEITVPLARHVLNAGAEGGNTDENDNHTEMGESDDGSRDRG
jgi:hypothetical protein